MPLLGIYQLSFTSIENKQKQFKLSPQISTRAIYISIYTNALKVISKTNFYKELFAQDIAQWQIYFNIWIEYLKGTQEL